MTTDGWKDEAKRYAGNADYWRDRAEKAEAELKAVQLLRDAVTRTLNKTEAERDALRSYNERVSVCPKHVDEIVDGECVICERDALREAANEALVALNMGLGQHKAEYEQAIAQAVKARDMLSAALVSAE